MLDDLYELSYSGIVALCINVFFVAILTTLLIMIPYYLYKNNKKEKINHLFIKGAFIFYLVSLLIVTVYRFGLTINYPSINIIPIKSLIDSFRYSYIDNPSMALPVLLYNIFGNIIWFIPMGFFVAYLLQNESFVKTTFLCFCASLWIEIVQYILVVGISDIDDVIFNTIGGMIGYGIYYLQQKKVGKK